ncbi:hypothetical protein MTR67_007045, partial [Solanum verrucosum]
MNLNNSNVVNKKSGDQIPEKHSNLQDWEPKGRALSQVMHENQSTNPKTDPQTPVTTKSQHEKQHVEALDTYINTFVYAKCKDYLRRHLWERILHFADTNNVIPWRTVGDFNVITDLDEKLGGIPYNMRKSLEFIGVIEACGLMDLGFNGPKFTWSNQRGINFRIWKRLDRAMVNDKWLQHMPHTSITHLPSVGSDHCPLLMEMNTRAENHIKYFKFLNFWADQPSFLTAITDCWNRKIKGNPMWIFHQRMKRVAASTLSTWSKMQFGDIYATVRDYEERVKVAEEKLIHDHTEENRIALHGINAEYSRFMNFEDSILRQKSQLQWFKERDGYCSFWWDNWLGIGPFAHYSSNNNRFNTDTMSDFMEGGQRNLEKIIQQDLEAHVHSILATQFQLQPAIPDQPTWSLNTSGDFTVVRGKLPTNESLARFGVELSECYCCHTPGLDTIEHTFNSGIFANKPSSRKNLCILIEQCYHDTKVTLVQWIKPPNTWIKLNMDGSALSNLGKIGAGAILRDSNRKLLFAHSAPLGEGTNIRAEVAAATFGISWFVHLNYHKVILEVDSQLLVDCTFLCDDNILVVNDQTLVDHFDDRIFSSSKVNLCPPIVGTCSLNEGTLSCDESDATLVDPIDDQVDSSGKINLCPPSVGINDLNESLDHSTISYFSHVNLEVECLLKDNLLFDDDMTLESVHSEMPYNVGSVATLSGYQLFENPLWCDDTLSKDGNLFCEDDSTFIVEGNVNMKGDAYVLNVTSSLCVPILHMNCASLVYKVEAKLGNNLIEVHLCDTFLYYLFAYDDVSTFEWSTMILEHKVANRVNKGVLDLCSWISFLFDPGNELNCGICLVMLGQDDKNNLEGFVGAFPYDGKFFFRVYNLLEGPTLCMGKGSFLTPFLHYLFAYDLIDCASYGDKSYLSREGEVYLKFVMLSLCVPSCDVMSARILKSSFNLAYRNTLDDPYVHDTFLYYLFAYDESLICLKWALHFGQ